MAVKELEEFFSLPHFERQRALMKGFLRGKEVHTVSKHSVMVKCVFEHFLQQLI